MFFFYSYARPPHLLAESEPYRKMVMETIEKIVQNLGSSDIDQRLEELLIDGILYSCVTRLSSSFRRYSSLMFFLRFCALGSKNRPARTPTPCSAASASSSTRSASASSRTSRRFAVSSRSVAFPLGGVFLSSRSHHLAL